MTIQIGINISARQRKFDDAVNIERDRRIHDNFFFEGNSYDFDSGSKANISGTTLLASIAIGQGAADGNFRWNGATTDFRWIAKDNTTVLMDAQTVMTFGIAAAEHVRVHKYNARTLKDLLDHTLDPAADIHWPTVI